MHGMLSEYAAMTRVMNAVAAGTSDQNGTGVDCAGYDGVVFICAMGSITAGAVTSVKAQQSSDDGSADTYDDLAGSAVTIPDDGDNGIFWIDVRAPRKRYVRPVVERGTQNAVIDGIVALRYRNVKVPVTQTATGEKHYHPAEGTA